LDQFGEIDFVNKSPAKYQYSILNCHFSRELLITIGTINCVWNLRSIIVVTMI